MCAAATPAGYGRVTLARLLLSCCFFLPYIALYARALHIPLGLLLVIEALFALLTVACDLPAGHLADRIGPRQALLIGTGCEGIAALLLGAVPHAAVFWAVQPLFAAAQALTMGADSALAADVLRRGGMLHRFEEGEQRVQSASLAIGALVLGLGSALSLAGLRWTFLATAVAQFAAFIALLTVSAGGVIGVARIPLRVRARGLVAGVRGAPALRTDLGAIIMLGTAFSVLLYLVPLYYVGSGAGEHAVGLLAAAVSLAAAVGTARVGRTASLRAVVLVAAAAAGLLALDILAVTLLAAVAVSVAQARLLPRARARVLADLGGHGDATALSIVTTSRNLGFVVVAPFLGLLAAVAGVGGLAVACAALFLLGGTLLTAQLSTGAFALTPARQT